MISFKSHPLLAIVFCFILSFQIDLYADKDSNSSNTDQDQVNDNSDKDASPRSRPSRYSQARKRKIEKVTDIVSAYPNVSTYLQNNNMDANKLSYSDLEKVLNDMKFQSLNSIRTPKTVSSLNAPAQQGPSCLAQIVKVKSGVYGAIEQLRLTSSMNHNEERSISCTELTGVTNVVGQVNLKCHNSALYVLQESSCTIGGCSTHYSGFTSGVDPKPVDEIILANSTTAVGQNINKSCAEIYQDRNIANVRGAAQFSCTNRGWQLGSNSCEIRECDSSYTFTINDTYHPTDSRGRNYRNGDVGKSYDLALYSPDECVTKGRIKSVKFSFKAAVCGTKTPTFEVLQGGSISTGNFDSRRYRAVTATLSGHILNIGLSQRSFSSNANNLSICYPKITVTME